MTGNVQTLDIRGAAGKRQTYRQAKRNFKRLARRFLRRRQKCVRKRPD